MSSPPLLETGVIAFLYLVLLLSLETEEIGGDVTLDTVNIRGAWELGHKGER